MRTTVLMLVLSMSIVCAAEVPAKPREELNQPPVAEPDPEWLAAVERLRALPRPGEIKNAGVTASVADVYDLPDGSKARIKAVQDAYNAELLKRAEKWLAEQTALRDEFEKKTLAELPAEKREGAQKVLEYSHANWMTMLDRDAPFKKEFARRVEDLRNEKMDVDARHAAREKMSAWVHEQRELRGQKDAEIARKITSMLSEEDLKRLQPFIRIHVEPAPEPKK